MSEYIYFDKSALEELQIKGRKIHGKELKLEGVPFEDLSFKPEVDSTGNIVLEGGYVLCKVFDKSGRRLLTSKTYHDNFVLVPISLLNKKELRGAVLNGLVF